MFGDVDLLITPTMARLPGRIADEFVTATDAISIRNPSPFNIYGIPAITLPCGFSREGLPIGIQISGPALGELNVLTLAHAYEQATDWHQRVPALT